MIFVKTFFSRSSNKTFKYGLILCSRHALGCQKGAQRSEQIAVNIKLNHFSLSCGNFEKKAGNVKPSRVIIKNSKSEVLKKANTSPKIMLVDLNESCSVLHLDQAEKLARHRGLTLVQLHQDTKVPNLIPKYKLAKRVDVFGEEVRKPSKTKEKIKNFIIKSDILEHDLHSKLNMIMRSLNKKASVVIDIMNKNEDSKKAEDIFSTIKTEVEKIHKIQSVVTKNSGMRLKVVPGVVEKESETKNEHEGATESEVEKEIKKLEESQEK